LCRAVDVNRSVGGAGKVSVVLKLHGNPLAVVKPGLGDTPAWTAAIAAAPHASLIPRPSRSFFDWALSAAIVRRAAPTFAAAAMFPATQDAVAAVRMQVQNGFPPPPGTEAAELAAVDVYTVAVPATVAVPPLPRLTDTLI